MYLHATEYKFKHIYDISELKSYCDHATRDIQRAEQVIEQIRKYQMELYEHVQNVINTPIQKYVILQRSKDYSSGHVSFYVCLDHRPVTKEKQINGHWVKGVKEHEKSFVGKERHLAIKYAEQLAKQYNCKIERKGF